MKQPSTNRALLGPLAGTALLALSACSDLVISNPGITSETYTPQLLGYAANAGGMFVDVTGTPFPDAQAETNRVIEDALGRAHFGPTLPFFTEKPADYRSPYRVAMVFSPAPNANADRLCRGDTVPVAEDPGDTTVLAAFCNGTERLTSTRSWITAPAGPNDPAFDNLIRQTGIQLFPPDNFKRRGGGPRFRSN